MADRVLRLLLKGEGFVSGEKMSSELGITRAAVWKKVRDLRAKGFVIQSVPSQGYRLLELPDLSGEEIIAGVRGNLWKEVFCYGTVGSTNEVAVNLCAGGRSASGTVIIADRQHRGRGRLGRQWMSPPGLNIYMSMVLAPPMAPKDATLLTLLSSVACATALRDRCGADVSIKWPNDLMINGKKTGGILTETRADPDRIVWAVIGIGINVNMEADSFPGDLRKTATSIKAETGRYYIRSRLIIAILEEFERSYRTLLKKGRSPIISKWKGLSCTLGKYVSVTEGPRRVSGFAEDIDDEGILILRLTSGELKKMGAGDLAVIR